MTEWEREAAEHKEWLAGLKVGDEVVVCSTGAGSGGRKYKVVSAPKTRVTVDCGHYKQNFSRDGGYETGDYSIWNRAYIISPERYRRERAAAEARKSPEEKANDSRRRIESAIGGMSLPQLLEVEAAIKGIKKDGE